MALVSLVAAMDAQRLIGANGDMPWRLPRDMQRFVQVTSGKPIVMGRKTHESIGKALPGRANHVVSRDPNFAALGCVVHSSIRAALAATASASEVVVIGGSQLYSETLPHASRMYLTLIDHEFTGDTWFPAWATCEWQETWSEEHLANANNAYPMRFVNLDRIES
jgi:dihydrofolate reductase